MGCRGVKGGSQKKMDGNGDGGQLASTGKEEKRMPGGRPGGSQLQHSIRHGMEGASGGWSLESERGDGDYGWQWQLTMEDERLRWVAVEAGLQDDLD